MSTPTSIVVVTLRTSISSTCGISYPPRNTFWNWAWRCWCVLPVGLSG